jgi:hypothetical protein
MRIGIIGSRDACGSEEERYKIICGAVPVNCTEIVSGGAEGIDTLAERYAREHSLMFKKFEPEYYKYGKNAPLMRNAQIIEYANLILAFWDGKSRGTAQAVKLCCETDKPVEIFFV